MIFDFAYWKSFKLQQLTLIQVVNTSLSLTLSLKGRKQLDLFLVWFFIFSFNHSFFEVKKSKIGSRGFEVTVLVLVFTKSLNHFLITLNAAYHMLHMTTLSLFKPSWAKLTNLRCLGFEIGFDELVESP